MKHILTFIFCFFLSILFGQTRTLSVLGTSNYTLESNMNCALLQIENDSIGDYNLEVVSKLKLSEIAINLKGQKEYLFEKRNVKEFENGLEALLNIGFKIEKIFYKFKEYDFREEDQRALKAIENAKETATLMAKSINFRVVDLINIDDDIKRNKNSDWFSCNSEDIMKFLEKEGFTIFSFSSVHYPTESNERKMKNTYKIWVTYEIEELDTLDNTR